MRKTMVVALRDYQAAVKTKAFLIGLLMMPLMFGGGILVQIVFRNNNDTRDKRVAVVDRASAAPAGLKVVRFINRRSAPLDFTPAAFSARGQRFWQRVEDFQLSHLHCRGREGGQLARGWSS